MTSTHRGRGFKASIDFADKNRGYGIRKNRINSVDAIYGRTQSFPFFKVDHDRIMRREGGASETRAAASQLGFEIQIKGLLNFEPVY